MPVSFRTPLLAPRRSPRSVRVRCLTMATLLVALAVAPVSGQSLAAGGESGGLLPLLTPARVPWRDVQLRDQFDRRHPVVAPTRPTLLLLAERHGTTVLRGWAAALATFRPEPPASALPAPTNTEPPAWSAPHSVLHLGSVPPMFRRMVRRMLPQDTMETVLVDWQGEVVPALRRLLNSQAPALAVLIDPTGRLVGWMPLHTAQPGSAQVAALWQSLVARSRPLVVQSPSSPPPA